MHFAQQQRKRSLHGIWQIYNTTGLLIQILFKKECFQLGLLNSQGSIWKKWRQKKIKRKPCPINCNFSFTLCQLYHPADVWEGRSATIWWYRNGYNHDKKRYGSLMSFFLHFHCCVHFSCSLFIVLEIEQVLFGLWSSFPLGIRNCLLTWSQVHLYENLLNGCEMVESQYVL